MSNGDGASEDEIEFVDELKPGTQLMLGQYTIDSFLAAGGFGITYLAYDSLKRPVVIKECFPGSFCRRQNHSVMPRSRAHQEELKSIVRHFSKEALTLSKARHPNIVGVHQVFEENNTAYMALDYVEGRDLLEILQEDPDSLTPDQIKWYLERMLDAIGHVHAKGLLHRDISPDNIILDKHDEPVLIDFGAARETADKKASRLLSALRVVKDGYSPQEFYIVGSQQGPSCDLYSLAASFYHIITGELPPDSQSRLTAFAAGDPDPYVALASRSSDYPENFATALDKAMSILPKDRMQSAEDWQTHIEHGERAAPIAAEASESLAASEIISIPKPALVGGGALLAAAGVALAYFATRPDDAVEISAEASQATVAQESFEADQSAAAVEVATADAAVQEDVAPGAPSSEPVVSEASELIADDLREPDQPADVAEAVAVVAPDAEDDGLAVALHDISAPPVRPETLRANVTADTSDDTSLDVSAEIEEPEALTENDADPRIADAAVPAEQDQPARTPDQVVVSDQEDDNTSGLDTEIASTVEEDSTGATPEDTAQLVSSTWSVRLPFSPSPDNPREVGDVLLNAWSWLQTGTEIASVNGIEVDGIADIPAVLRQSSTLSDQTQLDLLIGARAPGSSTIEEYLMVVPVVERVTLGNGVLLESAFRGGTWQTSVSDVPSKAATSLNVGDVLIEYLSTGTNIDGRASLHDVLTADQGRAEDQRLVRVARDGEVLDVALFQAVGETPLTAELRPQKRPASSTASAPDAASTDIGTIEAASVMEFDVPSVPFSLSPTEPGVVVDVSDRAPFWLSPGVRIVSVDGTAVEDNTAIINAITQSVRAAGGEATVVVGTDARLSDAAIERRLRVGSVRQTVLLNGLAFASSDENGTAVTRVVQAPDGSPFRVGDKVVAYMATGETLGRETTLKSILDRELAAGQTSFSFAIERQGEMWVEGFNLAALAGQ